MLKSFYLMAFQVLLFLPNSSWAQEGIFTSIHHHYQSPRALGMGNAFIATADDYSALFYNPAGLARRDTGQINLALEFGGGIETTNFFKDFSDVDKSFEPGATDSAKFQAYATFLQKYYGKPLGFRIKPMEAIWVRPNWAVGLIPMDFSFEGQIHNQAAPTLDIRVFADTTLAYGYGDNIRGLLPGKLSWGTTLKFINRAYINREINSLDLAADPKAVRKEDARDGYTLDFDLGALYSPPIPDEGLLSVFKFAKPTFGAVVRNVLDYGFGSSFKLINKEKVEAPEKLHRVLDVGAKFEYPELWIFGGRGEVNFRDIMHPNFNTRRSFHLGFEFDWTMASWWQGSYRIGVNQGYPTLGASALLFFFNLDLVTYGEDIGTFSTPKENRVYMAKLNMDW
jgi:hypothetical protein